jgi:hypothetical protein
MVRGTGPQVLESQSTTNYSPERHSAIIVLRLSTPICEVCRKAPAKRDDSLCHDCAYYYNILYDLLDEHPDLSVETFDRLKEIYYWRAKKIHRVNSSEQAMHVWHVNI